MKKTIILLAIFASTFSFAQDEDQFLIPKGSWELSANLGLFGITSERTIPGSDASENDNFSFNISSGLGYFISNNWSIGADVGYSYSEATSINNTATVGRDFRSNLYRFEAFTKRYFALNSRFAFRVTGALSYGFADQRDRFGNPDIVTSDTDVEFYSASISPGLAFSLSDHFLLQANLGRLTYSRETSEDTEGIQEESDTVGFFLNPSSFNLGLSYVWN